jgi:cytoskeletal protein CcmA (bactofilin family)
MNDTRGSTSPSELSLIGKDATIEGKLTIKQSIRIDGRIIGEVEAADTVTVGSNGDIDGNIKAKNVVVGGKVKGSLNVTGKVTLESAAELRGDLSASRLTIEEGAIFNGRSAMEGGTMTPSKSTPPSPSITLDTPPDKK